MARCMGFSYHPLFINICDGKGLTRENSIAGSDTTSVAITTIVYHPMRSPAAYANLVAEIDAASQAGQLSATVQYYEAVGLAYLKAAAKRVCGSIPVLA